MTNRPYKIVHTDTVLAIQKTGSKQGRALAAVIAVAAFAAEAYLVSRKGSVLNLRHWNSAAFLCLLPIITYFENFSCGLDADNDQVVISGRKVARLSDVVAARWGTKGKLHRLYLEMAPIAGRREVEIAISFSANPQILEFGDRINFFQGVQRGWTCWAPPV